MRDRLNVYFPPAMLEQITDLAKRKRLSKSSIVSTAVASFFSPDSDDKREAAFVRRLDRLTRQVQRLERNVEISADTLALFIQFWLVLNPPLPSDRLKEAQIQSQLRYKGFIETLGRRLQGGHNFIQELSQDIEARKNYSEEES